MRAQLRHTFHDIISLENLLEAWTEFVKGKRTKPDVQLFSRHLVDNLCELHTALSQKMYKHGTYQAFSISDPKPRRIHKASVRDRVLHHAVCRLLYPFFDRTFITDSYSYRLQKGTHKALDRLRRIVKKVSHNQHRPCWILKCDITKFFASIHHDTLLGILDVYIPDHDILWLLEKIIRSFHSNRAGTGLPLGNLTSQLLVNVYMNEFDQFVKHHLKAKYYIRYADDFVFLSHDRETLVKSIPIIQDFLGGCLRLLLHPHKIVLQSFPLGIDFLGWVHFPYHRVLRTRTKRRMMKRLWAHPTNETAQSYLGLLSHGNTNKIHASFVNDYWLLRNSF